jgi:hypothetical protein
METILAKFLQVISHERRNFKALEIRHIIISANSRDEDQISTDKIQNQTKKTFEMESFECRINDE